jgi:hypothetical protein
MAGVTEQTKLRIVSWSQLTFALCFGWGLYFQAFKIRGTFWNTVAVDAFFALVFLSSLVLYGRTRRKLKLSIQTNRLRRRRSKTDPVYLHIKRN